MQVTRFHKKFKINNSINEIFPQEEEKWENATLANKFMFFKVMTANPDLCRRFIEYLLHIEIERIEPPNGEVTFKASPDSHGIRLDV